MEERFDEPGGGYLNLDIFRRAIDLPGAELVVLLGEATFHQLHGGVATNVTMEHLLEKTKNWHPQYSAIRGHLFTLLRPKNPPTYLGVLPRPVLARFVRAAIDPVAPGLRSVEPPLGPAFDRALWSLTPTPRPTDPTLSALVDLVQNEFRAGRYQATAAIARLIRARAPDEPEPQRLLALVSGWHRRGDPPAGDANYHLALSETYRLLGENDRAAAEYQTAMQIQNRASIGIGQPYRILASLRLLKKVVGRLIRFFPKSKKKSSA